MYKRSLICLCLSPSLSPPHTHIHTYKYRHMPLSIFYALPSTDLSQAWEGSHVISVWVCVSQTYLMVQACQQIGVCSCVFTEYILKDLISFRSFSIFKITLTGFTVANIWFPYDQISEIQLLFKDHRGFGVPYSIVTVWPWRNYSLASSLGMHDRKDQWLERVPSQAEGGPATACFVRGGLEQGVFIFLNMFIRRTFQCGARPEPFHS